MFPAIAAQRTMESCGWNRHGRSRRPRFEFTPRLETLEDRILPAPVPVAVLSPSTSALVGDTMPLSVTFGNTGDATGYGPFIDVELPTAGSVNCPFGVAFTPGSATYLGQSVSTDVLTFNASGQAVHPIARTVTGQPLIVTGTPGDELVVFTLPLGSFTPGQPSANVNFSVQVNTMAEPSVPLTAQATGGFQFGADPLDNPTVDPSILGPTSSDTITPEVFILTKTYLGPEQETATGPNYTQQYQISARVAAGQTVTGFDLTDTLPSDMQFVSVDLVSANGGIVNPLASQTPSTTTPGGLLERKFTQVVGTGSADDVVLKFSFYVPLDDASNNAVLAPGTGANAAVTDDAAATGSFVDCSGTTLTVTGSDSDTITAKQVATQKSVADVTDVGAPGPSPGDTLQYTVNFQVSDFFALQNLNLTDVISDGQSFDVSFVPTITFTQQGTALSGGFSSGSFSVTRDTVTTGQTTVSFNISQELSALGLSTGNQVLGRLGPAGGHQSDPTDSDLRPDDGHHHIPGEDRRFLPSSAGTECPRRPGRPVQRQCHHQRPGAEQQKFEPHRQHGQRRYLGDRQYCSWDVHQERLCRQRCGWRLTKRRYRWGHGHLPTDLHPARKRHQGLPDHRLLAVADLSARFDHVCHQWAEHSRCEHGHVRPHRHLLRGLGHSTGHDGGHGDQQRQLRLRRLQAPRPTPGRSRTSCSRYGSATRHSPTGCS